MISDGEHFFRCLLAICIASPEKCLFKSICPFLNQAVRLFLSLLFMYSGYQILTRCIICGCFLPAYTLPFRQVSAYFNAQLYVVRLLLSSRSAVSDSAAPWTAARQASLSCTSSQDLRKLMSIESSNHFILCCPLLLMPSIFPSIRVFSSETALRIR